MVEELREGVTQNGEAQRRLGAPEALQVIRVQLLDHFLAARPRIIRSPHLQRWRALRQIGEQGLIKVARALQQHCAAWLFVPPQSESARKSAAAAVAKALPGATLGSPRSPSRSVHFSATVAPASRAALRQNVFTHLTKESLHANLPSEPSLLLAVASLFHALLSASVRG